MNTHIEQQLKVLQDKQWSGVFSEYEDSVMTEALLVGKDLKHDILKLYQ